MEKVIKAGATNERGFNENRRDGGRPPRLDHSPPRRVALRATLGGGSRGLLRRDSFRDRSHDRGGSRYGTSVQLFLYWEHDRDVVVGLK